MYELIINAPALPCDRSQHFPPPSADWKFGASDSLASLTNAVVFIERFAARIARGSEELSSHGKDALIIPIIASSSSEFFGILWQCTHLCQIRTRDERQREKEREGESPHLHDRNHGICTLGDLGGIPSASRALNLYAEESRANLATVHYGQVPLKCASSVSRALPFNDGTPANTRIIVIIIMALKAGGSRDSLARCLTDVKGTLAISSERAERVPILRILGIAAVSIALSIVYILNNILLSRY